MKCSKCGNSLTEESFFCSFCGAKVINEQSEDYMENHDNVDEKDKNSKISEENQKYDIVLYSVGKGFNLIVNYIQKNANCSISEARNIVKNLPVTLFSSVDYLDAKTWTEIMEKIFKTKIGLIEREKNPFGAQVIAYDFYALKRQGEGQNAINEIKILSSSKKISLMEILSSVFSFIACLILLFCPLFFINQISKINGEDIITKKYYSLFNLVYCKIQDIINGSNVSYTIFFDFIYIFVGVSIVVQTFKALIKTIEKIIKYVNVGKQQNETVCNPFMHAKQNSSSRINMFIDCIALFVLGGYDGIVVGTLIAIAIIIAIGFVLEKIIKLSNDKLRNKKGEK